MKVSIFGASGATGLLLTEHSLAADFEVKALLRSPQRFPYRERVNVIEGNAFDPVAVRRTVEGADIVLSPLGARFLRRKDVLERAVPLIAAAMRQTGVRRIIALGSAGVEDTSLDKQPAWRRWFVQKVVYNTFLKWPVAPQRAQLAALSASGLDWTMVMPPMLLKSPAAERQPNLA